MHKRRCSSNAALKCQLSVSRSSVSLCHIQRDNSAITSTSETLQDIFQCEALTETVSLFWTFYLQPRAVTANLSKASHPSALMWLWICVCVCVCVQCGHFCPCIVTPTSSNSDPMLPTYVFCMQCRKLCTHRLQPGTIHLSCHLSGVTNKQQTSPSSAYMASPHYY